MLRKNIELLTELARTRYVSPIPFAESYASLGEKDKAFAWLEKAYQERAGGLVFLKVAPQYDPLRSDSRYQDVLRRMNLLLN